MIKSSLRSEALSRRLALQDAQIQSMSEQWKDNFLRHVSLLPTDIVAGYYPMRKEIDILPLLHHLEQVPYQIVLPFIKQMGVPLLFKQWRTSDDIEKSQFLPVWQPYPDKLSIVPTIILVPLVAFDSHGYRLGYGGGFYDLTIALFRKKYPNTRFMGCAYDMQHLDYIPIESHDQRLDAVVTNTQYFTF